MEQPLMRKREGSINVKCTRPPYFTQINPLGKIPALKKGKFVLSESAAIATYVANAHDLKGELYPRDPKTRGRVERAVYFNEGVFYAAFGNTVVS